MKRTTQLIAFGVFVVLTACGPVDPNKQVDEGTVKGETYTSEEIGWTVEIPSGWSITLKDQMEETTELGQEYVEELGVEFDVSGLKHLIGFQKDRFNMFQSTSEPFDLEYEGEWEANNATLKDVIYSAYAKQGIQVDTSSSKVTVDGLEFEGFHITMYGPEGNVVFYQDMYSRYINGFDFAVNLNYNNEEHKEAMLNAWMNSKFENPN